MPVIRNMDPFGNDYSTFNWYNDRIYRRYWQHYDRAMEWKRRHQLAYYKAKDAANQMERKALTKYFIESVKSVQKKELETRKVVEKQRLQNEEEEEEKHVETDEFEMEITDEMIAFLEKSDKHRRELKAKREAADKLEEEEAESNYSRERATGRVAPPSEQPGVKRTAEMKQLYGKRAAMIHGMETAVQLTFNRNCDRFQPKYWPNMPIRLKFNNN